MKMIWGVNTIMIIASMTIMGGDEAEDQVHNDENAVDDADVLVSEEEYL